MNGEAQVVANEKVKSINRAIGHSENDEEITIQEMKNKLMQIIQDIDKHPTIS